MGSIALGDWEYYKQIFYIEFITELRFWINFSYYTKWVNKISALIVIIIKILYYNMILLFLNVKFIFEI